ncbi:MAG: septal ring lytic transglycosylase RlpA family protein [Solirubrobacterales bacterium]|nr:septal ring lytic transglycosylase RlpA family protein [Solirubrobacterales bacterium]
MQAGKDRLERQDHPRRGRVIGKRLLRRMRWAALFAVGAAAALGAVPAQAAPGGATAGRGTAFSAMRYAGATWYGPGFYGNRTACGKVLRPRTVGVAHRSLPCGTAVRFVYRGRLLVTRVIDRGPYVRGYAWDLTNGAHRALRFNGSGRLRYAVARRFARR